MNSKKLILLVEMEKFYVPSTNINIKKMKPNINLVPNVIRISTDIIEKMINDSSLEPGFTIYDIKYVIPYSGFYVGKFEAGVYSNICLLGDSSIYHQQVDGVEVIRFRDFNVKNAGNYGDIGNKDKIPYFLPSLFYYLTDDNTGNLTDRIIRDCTVEYQGKIDQKKFSLVQWYHVNKSKLCEVCFGTLQSFKDNFHVCQSCHKIDRMPFSSICMHDCSGGTMDMVGTCIEHNWNVFRCVICDKLYHADNDSNICNSPLLEVN